MARKKSITLTCEEIQLIRGAMYTTAAKNRDYAIKTKDIYDRLGKILDKQCMLGEVHVLSPMTKTTWESK